LIARLSFRRYSKPKTAPKGTKKALALTAKCLICKAFLVGRGNLKQVGIYLFLQVNNCSVNLLGIPVGTLRGLASDGRCFLSSAPSTNWHRIYQANGRVNVSHGW
jgi:hypothetical protein